VKHIEAFSGFMDRGDCSRSRIVDGDSAPIREKDLSAPSARELTKRIGSLRHFLRLVNDSSGGASSIDKIADEAGKPFGLVGNTARCFACARPRRKKGGDYGWTGQQPSSGFFDRPPATLGVFASLDRL
jgi:hypothetical protein